MNVRERAKTYEAFMSKSSSMEREKKRVREDGIETSGAGISDKKKMAEEGKTKPVPPPRKKKPLEKDEKSPQLQHRSTFSMQLKSPPIVHPRPSKPLPTNDTDKPKPSKKPPPPRPAPYQQPSSPSLGTKAPQPRTVPQKPSPVARLKPDGSPKTSTKETPKRPPPPSKAASLPRKPKPPVPPKPSRPLKPVTGAEGKKSATLPKTGSLKPENKENVETKAERSLTDPHRISVQNSDEVEKTEKVAGEVTEDKNNEEKVALHLDAEKPDEDVIEKKVQNAELEEQKETQELRSENTSLAKDLSENGKISNGVSQEDKHTRTLNEEILRDDKEPETILKEEILENTDEKLNLDKNDIIENEELTRAHRTENDTDVTMEEHSEKCENAPNEDEENKPSQTVSLENMENVIDVDLCEETPSAMDSKLEEKKILQVSEEKTIDTTEDGEVIVANGHLEDAIENGQSLPNEDTRLTHTTEQELEESIPVDMIVEDANQESGGINNDTDVSVTLGERAVCTDEEMNGVDDSLERKEVQQVGEVVVYDEDKSHLSKETVQNEETSGEQDAISEVLIGLDEQLDVQQTEETRHLDADEILEAINKEPQQLPDEDKHDQDDSVQGVETVEENEKKETAVDKEEDVKTRHEEYENAMKAGDSNVKEEMEEKTLEDAPQVSDVTKEDNVVLEEEMVETATDEKSSGQIDKTQSSLEEMECEANETDHQQVAVDNAKNGDTEMIEDQARTEETLKEEILEKVPETQEIISSEKTKKVDQENDPFSLDEPIRPRRPSRLKKLAKNNIKQTEAITSKPLVETQKQESCKEEEAQGKSVGAYESVILNASSKDDLPESSEDQELHVTEKPSPGYENIILPSEAGESPESECLALKEDLSEPLQESRQYVIEKPSPRYENVILPSEDDKILESGSPSIYEVPRRSSFHSHTPAEKMARKTRSSSIGSLERKNESIYQVPKPRSRTVAEQTYVVPRSSRLSTGSSENDETYVVPKAAIRATPATQESTVFESEYHVPQSLMREESAESEYQVPPRSRTSMTGSEEEEGVYSVPTSPSTVPRGSRMEHVSGSEEEEGVYSVPTSSAPARRETQVEPERARQSSGCDDESVYSVPSSTPVAKESESTSDVNLPEEGGLRRSSRSSVLTSRNQLPTSFKHAPPKPPRKSILGESKGEEKISTSAQEDEASKPVPAPREIPQPKPRRGQTDGLTENKEEQLPTPSPPKDQSKSSPKPKRPAPPRPKAPAVSPLSDKEKEVTVTVETKNHSAPPRPPPPSVNRTSLAPSEPESVSSTTGLHSGSSESESEEEKPSEPTGPPKTKTYFIAHEILSTEKTFVNALTLCYEDCYGLIQNADVIPESTLNDIFKDLGNIYHLDCKFLQELEERMKTWDEHERIGDIVKKYGHFLKMYTTYINNYDKSMNVLQETTKENPQFAELVNQFQASEKCNGLFLISFMLKPVQRIPSYRLLLKDYLKHLPPDSDEFKDIKVALDIVSEVATHINESMKKADNFERVLRIQESLVGNAEIVKPGRDLIKEGVLKKLCRKDMQERMFFLLTDVLLYTAPVGSTQYKLKEKLPLLGMKVTLSESPDFENEFSIISKMRSFTLSASTPAERDEWIEELKNAINALADKKKTFLKPKDGIVAETEVEEESKLGEKAPVWIPDARVTMCMLCTDNFTVTNRRHHCRGCGKVVCGSCSDNLAPLAYLDYTQARVCEVCYDFLLKEQNKSETNTDFERLPASPLGMTNEDLDRIHRKPPKFEILHRFKPGSRSHAKRKSKAFGRPSVCTEVVGHDSGSQMSGYLKFKRTNRHGWKRLWFVLKDNVLYTYKASEDVVAIETIPILGYIVQEATRTEDEIQFQLKHAGLPPITFKTESESSVSRWIQELKKATTL